MIYISSSCFKIKHINKLINYCIKNDINNIELSGGTKFQNQTYNFLNNNINKINFGIHNYFPAPKKNFIINLGSTNKNIREKSIEFCEESIKLCKKLKIKKYSVHAPFLIDFGAKEAGHQIKKRRLYDRKLVTECFKNSWVSLRKIAKKDVKLYIENNVLSLDNYKKFEYQNPFLLTDTESFFELKKKIKFNLLLDVAHLKVSARTLNKNFSLELNNLSKFSDYFHISENNGFFDQNKGLKRSGIIYNFLKKNKFKKNTIFTLEVYQDLKTIIYSRKLLQEII